MRPFLLFLGGGALLALACGAYGYYAGHAAGDHHRNNAWLAKQAVQQQQALKALQAAQAHGDFLSSQLLANQQQIDQIKTEQLYAVQQASTGRPCLNGATLRVLDHAPGLSVRALPQTTGSAVAASEPLVAAGGDSAWYSTDTQIALWAVDAGAQYEVCRARLEALIEWHTP